MNLRIVFRTCAMMLLAEGLLLVLPLITAIIYGESCAWSILGTIGIALILGSLGLLLTKTEEKVIYSREGFIITALSWLVWSAVGALPFVFSGEIPSYIDAFFETVSGFTTTGASILRNVEEMSHGLLFWRSFTHWVGGMGILVMVMAVLPKMTDRSIHIMRAEMPGPIEIYPVIFLLSPSVWMKKR